MIIMVHPPFYVFCFQKKKMELCADKYVDCANVRNPKMFFYFWQISTLVQPNIFISVQ